jgi:hypothetical protein
MIRQYYYTTHNGDYCAVMVRAAAPKLHKTAPRVIITHSSAIPNLL